MWEAVIPSAISAIGSLFGGASSNAANAKLAAQQMAFQERMMDKQMSYNTDMVSGANAQNWDMFNWQKDFASDQFRTGMDFNRESRDMSYDFAKDVMAYNTEMSNTAYQRATRDMRAAGLNPILAYSQGGASSPSGTMPSSPGAMGVGAPSGATAPVPGVSPGQGARAEMRDVITPAISSAMQGARAIQGLEAVGAQIDRTRADTQVATAQADNVRAQTGLAIAQELSERERPENVRATTLNTIRQANLALRQTRTEEERPGLVRSQAHEHSARAENVRQDTGITHNWGRSNPAGNTLSTLEAGGRRGVDITNTLRQRLEEFLRTLR